MKTVLIIGIFSALAFWCGHLTATKVASTKASLAVDVPDQRSSLGETLEAPASTNGSKMLPRSSQPIADNRATALSALASLRDAHPDSVKIPVLTRRDKIEDSFAALLALSPEQIASLNAALSHAREALNALSIRAAQVTFPDDETTTIIVPPIEGGPMVYDTLMDSFTQILGEPKSLAFRNLLEQQLAEAFNNFGAENRIITIASTLPGHVDWKDGGLYAKDERQTSTGRTEKLARFRADRMQYLFPELQLIEPLVGDRLKKKMATKE